MNKTQRQILNFLDDKKYVSSEDIAQKLGISRAAILKNIKTLKDDYQIIVSSNSRVGYLLEEKLDIIKIDDLAKALLCRFNIKTFLLCRFNIKIRN